MLCSLFSSFDPVSSFPLINISFLSKWLFSFFFFLFWSWQSFSLSVGIGKIFHSIFSFILSVISDLFSKSNQIVLMSSSIFFAILIFNFMGLVPFSFSITSHLSMNLSFSLPLWMSGIGVFISCSIYSFISHLVPFGSPVFLWPLLVLVESVSLLIRPLSLSVRLMANVMAGHMIMSLLGGFLSMFDLSLSLSFFMSGILLFEAAISAVQAYVFVSLLTLYWKESEDH